MTAFFPYILNGLPLHAYSMFYGPDSRARRRLMVRSVQRLETPLHGFLNTHGLTGAPSTHTKDGTYIKRSYCEKWEYIMRMRASTKRRFESNKAAVKKEGKKPGRERGALPENKSTAEIKNSMTPLSLSPRDREGFDRLLSNRCQMVAVVIWAGPRHLWEVLTCPS